MRSEVDEPAFMLPGFLVGVEDAERGHDAELLL